MPAKAKAARAVPAVTREQVIAARIGAQGLLRDGPATVARLAILDLGVQDSVADGARLAFDARLAQPQPAGRPAIGPDEPLALLWSLRGAPHVHRRRDLDRWARGLWPRSDDDAGARMNQTRPHLARAGLTGLDSFRGIVEALHGAIAGPTPKGEVSTALTALTPDGLRGYCRVCQVTHVGDMVLRATALGAGFELEPGTAPPVLVPRTGAAWPVSPDDASGQRLITDYLTLLGPATPTEVAGYFDIRRADLEAIWPSELVEVSVDGQRAWLPPGALNRLSQLGPTDRPELVRLLNPFDPYLQARDRNLIVPDRRYHKALWPVLGRPGVLLVDAEVAGTWRPRASGRKLTVAVATFGPQPPSVWTRIEAEAQRVAVVRGADELKITGR